MRIFIAMTNAKKEKPGKILSIIFNLILVLMILVAAILWSPVLQSGHLYI